MFYNRKSLLLAVVTLVSLVAMLLVPRIPQPLSFHHFADDRPLWGIPNFGNVASNLAFLVVAVVGLGTVARSVVTPGIRVTYILLFLGVLLTGLGSAYYHWNPNNDTLVWDRIPMTIVFMSLLAATVTELVNRRLGTGLLFPLVAVGIGSVLWWHYTETLGKGDLRLYFWVQYYPMVAIPLILWLFYSPAVTLVLRCLVWVVIWYVIAKVFEQLDYPIFRAIGISGHTLKHLAAAVSTWYFVVLFRRQYVDLSVGAAAMSRSAKPKAVFTYCFQIWMTAVLLGPVVSLYWLSKNFTGVVDWLGFEVGIGLYSLMFSLPGIVLFSGGAAFLFLRSWPVGVKRVVLGVWGILLTIATFGFLFQAPVSTHLDVYPGSLCYLLPSFIGVWIYRWPGRLK